MTREETFNAFRKPPIQVPPVKLSVNKDLLENMCEMQDYESPISITQHTMYREMQEQYENTVYEAVHQYGVDVNKDELLRALAYDREQYGKGYKGGYEQAILDLEQIMLNKYNSLNSRGKHYVYEFYRDCMEDLKGGEE